LKSKILLIAGIFWATVGNLVGDILRFPVGIGGGCCRDFDLFNTLIGELCLGLVCVCWIIILFFEVVEELNREFFVLYTSFTIFTFLASVFN
jgi:hypothetical protein